MINYLPLCVHAHSQAGKDFYEGVRAVLVDRDNSPQWTPSTLQDVTDELVDKYFARLPEDRELKL